MTNELFAIQAAIAKAMPKPLLIDVLQNYIDKYKNARLKGDAGDTEFTGICACCQLILIKDVNMEPDRLVKELEAVMRMKNLINPNQQ